MGLLYLSIKSAQYQWQTYFQVRHRMNGDGYSSMQ